MERRVFLKKVFNAGVVSIPIEIRSQLNILTKTPVDVRINDNNLIVLSQNQKGNYSGQIDSLGRLIIHAEIRGKLGIKPGSSEVQVYTDGSDIILEKVESIASPDIKKKKARRKSKPKPRKPREPRQLSEPRDKTVLQHLFYQSNAAFNLCDLREFLNNR